MRSKSENITFTSYNDANKNVKELFDSLNQDTKTILKDQWKEVDLFLILFK